VQTLHEKTLYPHRILQRLLRVNQTKRVPRSQLCEHTCKIKSCKVVSLKNKKSFFVNIFHSYWDWLPLEIQVYILQLAALQYFLELKTQIEMECRDQSIRHKLRKEIIDYGALKNAWGLGPIQCKFMPCIYKHCPRRFSPWHNKKCLKDFMIVGHYFYEQTKHSVYLGYSYKHAHSRLQYVKSDLWKK